MVSAGGPACIAVCTLVRTMHVLRHGVTIVGTRLLVDVLRYGRLPV